MAAKKITRAVAEHTANSIFQNEADTHKENRTPGLFLEVWCPTISMVGSYMGGLYGPDGTCIHDNLENRKLIFKALKLRC